MQINRRKVAFSIIIPFVTVFSTISLFINFGGYPKGKFVDQFLEIFLGSSVLWLPMVIICLIMEFTILKSSDDNKRLRQLLIGETLIATALSLHLFFAMIIIGTIGNILHYQWLIHKDRIYK